MRSLSGALDREETKSRAWVGTSSTANAVPHPRKDRVESEEWRVELSARERERVLPYPAPLLPIAYCLLPIAFEISGASIDY